MKGSFESRKDFTISTVSPTPKKEGKNKKSSSKSNSKEKDKTLSIDSQTTTKRTFFLHRKTNNSSIHNHSETNVSSQFKDSSSKERDAKILGLTPPKKIHHIDKKISFSPVAGGQEGNKQSLKALDWVKVLSSKEKEIKNLEDITITMNKEVDRAMSYIETHKFLPELLQEKEEKLNQLTNQLSQVTQEIKQLKLYSKANSIHHIPISIRDEKYKKKDEKAIFNRNPFDKAKSKDHFESFENRKTLGYVEAKENYKGKNIKEERKQNISHVKNQGHVSNASYGGIQSLPIDIVGNINDPLSNQAKGLKSAQKGNKQIKGHEEQRGFKSYREKEHQTSKSNPLEKLLRKLKRSFSPQKSTNYQNEKFKMYIEDPTKKLTSQYLKLKPLLSPAKDYVSERTKSKHLVKNNKTNLGENKAEPSQLQKEIRKTRKNLPSKKISSSLSPKRDTQLTQKIKREREKSSDIERMLTINKALTPKAKAEKHVLLKSSKTGNEKNIVDNIGSILEGFYSLAENYKTLVKVLKTKNDKLGKKVREQSENKINLKFE